MARMLVLWHLSVPRGDERGVDSCRVFVLVALIWVNCRILGICGCCFSFGLVAMTRIEMHWCKKMSTQLLPRTLSEPVDKPPWLNSSYKSDPDQKKQQTANSAHPKRRRLSK